MPLFTILLIALLLLAFAFMIIWLVATIIFGVTTIFGAPYVATSDEKLKTMLEMVEKELKNLNPKPYHLNPIKIADLGSGNGKVLIAIAQLVQKLQSCGATFDAEFHGYEINPILVWKSRWNIYKYQKTQKQKNSASSRSNIGTSQRHSDKTIWQYSNIKIYSRSFFSADLSSYHLITLYATTNVMSRLEKKLRQELKPGAIVISNYFRFPNWKPLKSTNHVHLYKK